MKRKLKDIYTNINKLAFWLCLSFSVILIGASMIIPPTGEIHKSVLMACGELFSFATLGTVIAAIEKGTDIKLKKGDTEVTIDNPDKK